MAAQLLAHFNTPWTNHPNSYTILPPGSSTLTSFYPLGTNYRLTLTSFHPLGSPALSSLYALWSNHAPLLHHFTPCKLNSYLNLPHLNKLPPPPSLLHHFTPLAAQLLAHFNLPLNTSAPTLTPLFSPGSSTRTSIYISEQTTSLHSLLNHFTPLAAQLLAHSTPYDRLTSNSYTTLPLGSSTLTSFYPLWTTTPSTHSYTILPPLAVQLLAHFTPYDRIKSNSYTTLPLGSSTLTSIYPLSTNYLTSLLHHFTHLASQLLAHFNLPLNTSAPTLNTTFLPWQLNSYLNLHLWTNYPPPPLSPTPVYSLGSPALNSF